MPDDPFTSDDRCRTALRSIAAAPLPPAATTLDQVIRLGRRRALARRAGALGAAVLGVVAVVGIGVGVAGSRAAPDVTTADRAAPARAPDTELMPGFRWVGVPAADRTEGGCTGGGGDGGGEGAVPDLELPAWEQIHALFFAAVSGVADGTPEPHVDWQVFGAPPDQRWGLISFAVPIGGETTGTGGHARLEVRAHAGPPTTAADRDLAVYHHDCRPVARRVLADGTVLQVYQPGRLVEGVLARYVRIYRPGGRLYVLATTGRDGLPLTQADLVSVGLTLAEFAE